MTWPVALLFGASDSRAASSFPGALDSQRGCHQAHRHRPHPLTAARSSALRRRQTGNRRIMRARQRHAPAAWYSPRLQTSQGEQAPRRQARSGRRTSEPSDHSMAAKLDIRSIRPMGCRKSHEIIVGQPHFAHQSWECVPTSSTYPSSDSGTRMIGKCCTSVSAAWACFQFQGRSSSRRWDEWSAMRASTSASQA